MIYKRGNIWWVSFEENGDRHRRTLRTRDKDEAIKRAAAQIELRNARLAAQKAHELMAAAGVVPGGASWSWAAQRWSRLNPRERQAVIFALYGGRCVYCSCEVTIPTSRLSNRIAPDRAVMDHKVPISGGGPDTLDNIVLACNRCNLKKHDCATLAPVVEVSNV